MSSIATNTLYMMAKGGLKGTILSIGSAAVASVSFGVMHGVVDQDPNSFSEVKNFVENAWLNSMQWSAGLGASVGALCGLLTSGEYTELKRSNNKDGMKKLSKETTSVISAFAMVGAMLGAGRDYSEVKIQARDNLINQKHSYTIPSEQNKLPPNTYTPI